MEPTRRELEQYAKVLPWIINNMKGYMAFHKAGYNNACVMKAQAEVTLKDVRRQLEGE